MKVLVTFFLTITSLFVCAQGLKVEPAMVQYTVDNGLPSNTVHDIYCDSIGLMWMATDAGLVRFNGEEFFTYNKSDGLADNDLLRIRGQQNKMWFTTGNSDLTYYSDKQFSKIKAIVSAGEEQKFTYSVFEDSQDRIWTSNANLEITVIDSSAILRSKKQRQVVSFLFEYNQNIYGLAQSEGLVKFNPSDLSMTTVLSFRADYRQKPYLKGNFLISFSQENELIKVNLEDLTINELIDLEEIIGYAPIFYAVKEFNDSYYITSNDGLFIVKKDKQFKHILEGYRLSSICWDNEEGFWLGSLSNGCFNLPFKTANQINSSTNESELTFLKFINDTLYLSNDKTLFVSSEDVITRVDISSFPSTVKDLVAVGDSLIVIGENGFGVVKNGYFKKISFRGNSGSIIKNNLIVGTHTGSYKIPLADIYQFNADSIPYDVKRLKAKLMPLEILDSKTREVLKVSEDSIILSGKNGLFLYHFKGLDTIGSIEDLLANSIKACAYDGKGIVLVATESNELFEYSLKSKQSKSVHNDTVESKIHVNDIAYDTLNNLWLIASNQGVIIYDRSIFIKLGTRAGLPSTVTTQITAKNGILYSVASKGIFEVDISELIENTKTPTLILEKFYSPEQSTTNNFLQTPYNKTDIFIKTLISSVKYKVKYAYSINDELWRFSDNGLISLSYLAPGTYSVRVKAITENRVESNTIKVVVKVLAPYWLSWWFKLVVLFVIILAFYLFFKLKVLAYNKDVVKEILQLIINKLKKRKKVEYKNAADGAKTILYLEDIIRIQGAREYVEIQTTNRIILVKKTMKALLSELNMLDKKNKFIQVHKSFIISLDKVEAYHYQFIKMTSEEKIPIGRAYRQNLKELLPST